jgi:hypothetical protein
LNNLKETPEYEQSDKNKDTNDVIMWDKNCTPIELSQGSEVHNDTSTPSQMPTKPINKNEIVSKLRKYTRKDAREKNYLVEARVTVGCHVELIT